MIYVHQGLRLKFIRGHLRLLFGRLSLGRIPRRLHGLLILRVDTWGNLRLFDLMRRWNSLLRWRNHDAIQGLRSCDGLWRGWRLRKHTLAQHFLHGDTKQSLRFRWRHPALIQCAQQLMRVQTLLCWYFPHGPWPYHISETHGILYKLGRLLIEVICSDTGPQVVCKVCTLQRPWLSLETFFH